MSVLVKISSVFIGLVSGEQAKQKFLFRKKIRRDEKKLKNFWQKSGLSRLDEIEIRGWHHH
jgi:hypothetical protein